MRFKFVADFDTNGVLHYFGTAAGSEGYANPHTSGVVVAAMSSVMGNDPGFCNNPYYGSAERSVQNQCHRSSKGKRNGTNSEPNSWMSVDLGQGHSLIVDHYCLRMDYGAFKPRNWELQGSDDGDHWHTLRRHQADSKLAETSLSTANWPVEAGGRFFRQFRILQTGLSSFDTHVLQCAGIELYGTLREE